MVCCVYSNTCSLSGIIWGYTANILNSDKKLQETPTRWYDERCEWEQYKNEEDKRIYIDNIGNGL